MLRYHEIFPRIWNSSNFSCYLNPLTPGPCCKKCVFWTFWWFLGWISAKAPLIGSKMRLQLGSLLFLPPASRFSALWLRHGQKSKFWESDLCLHAFRFLEFFFRLSFFSFCLLFAIVIDFLLGLLAVKKLLRKCHRGGQILAWSSQV